MSLNNALETLGELLADNLTSKGVPSTPSDGLTTLANKIINIPSGGEEYLFFDDATINKSVLYEKVDNSCAFSWNSNGYYVLKKTDNVNQSSGVRIADTLFPRNVRIVVDICMTTTGNTQPKLLLKNPASTYGYCPRLTYTNRRASIIESNYTTEGNSITGDSSYMQSINTWYTFDFTHKEGTCLFTIYESGNLGKKLVISDGSLNIASTGNEVCMLISHNTNHSYNFKNLKIMEV